MSYTILKEAHIRTIPVKFGLIWFSSFRGDMHNLHNRYKSTERLTFELISIYSKAGMDIWRIMSFFSNYSHLEWRVELSNTSLKGIHTWAISARFGLIWFGGFRGEDLNVKVYHLDGHAMAKSSHGLWPSGLNITKGNVR